MAGEPRADEAADAGDQDVHGAGTQARRCWRWRQRLAPVVEQVAQRLLERDARLPAGVGPELRAVADQDLDVGGAQALGIDLDPDLDVGEREQAVEHARGCEMPLPVAML